MHKKVLLLEFNELTPRLMDRFINEERLPNFRRLRDESHVFTTDAEEAPDYLDPWIQWVTVHTGLRCAEHGVLLLNEAHKLAYPSIWDLVSNAGRSVWVCGSMNAKVDTKPNGWVLPDPWTDAEAHPSELNRFYRFVRNQIQEHSNDRQSPSLRQVVDFLAFLCSHGLSVSTVKAVISQLLEERRSDSRWKRAVLLDRMQWDLFKWHWRRTRPDFSTFFLNSTAHFQHVYWRSFEPDNFTIKPSDEDRRRTESAIPFGYEQMDRIVNQALQLAGDDTIVILATALSQQPYLRMESDGGKILHRPKDVTDFPRQIGLPGKTHVVPVMAEQFHIYFDQESDAISSFEIISQIQVGDRLAFPIAERHGNSVFVGCRIFEQLAADAQMILPGGRTIPFYDVFYIIKDSLKSGMHHPDGMLWIRMPEREHSAQTTKVPLTAVAPTIMKLLGISAPSFMRSEPLGLGQGRTGSVIETLGAGQVEQSVTMGSE
jgi:hypothetical protein